MTYSNVPLSGQSLGNTRIPINTNFSLIQSTISQDHFAIGSTNAGKHRVSHYPQRSDDSVTAANEIALYCKADGSSPGQPNLFMRAQSNGFVYQLTKVIAASTASFAGTTNGWTFLPGGLILQYGSVVSPGGSGTITYPVAFPSTNPPFSIQLTISSTSTNSIASVDKNTPPTSLAFKYFAAGTSATLYWIALGN